MAYRFFHPTYNKLYPRIAGGGEIEFTVSTHVASRTTSVQVGRVISEVIQSSEYLNKNINHSIDSAKIESISSLDKVTISRVAGTSILELVMANAIISPERFVGVSFVELPVSIDAPKMNYSVNKSKLEFTLSSDNHGLKVNSVGRIKVEDVSSTDGYRLSNVVGGSKIEQTVSNVLSQLNFGVDRSEIETISSVVSNEINVSSDSSVEINISKYNSSFRQSTDADIEMYFSNRINKIKHTSDAGVESNFSTYFSKIKQSSDSSVESSFSENVILVKQSTDAGAESSFSEPTIEYKQSTDASVEIASAYFTTEIKQSTDASVEIIDSNNTDSIGRVADKIEDELITSVRKSPLRRSTDTANSEVLASNITKAVKSAIDRCVGEIFSADNLTPKLKQSLSQILFEQTISEIVRNVSDYSFMVESVGAEGILNGPPIPDYGMGIGALIKDIFIEVTGTEPLSYQLKSIYIESVIQELISQIVNLYVDTLTVELMAKEENGVSTSIKVDAYISELCVADTDITTTEYVDAFFVEVSLV